MADQQRALTVASTSSAGSKSLLRQSILSEDDYTAAVSAIIKRDFFPQLHELDARRELADALASEDARRIDEQLRKVRNIVTPARTARRRPLAGTPGRTPFADETPYSQLETPYSHRGSTTPRSRPSTSQQDAEAAYDSSLSLDAFQSRYTSEDNASFGEILAASNAAKKHKFAWAYEAEQKANVKAITARENREKQVEMTRKMVDSDPNGEVRMIDGGAGKPGERRLLVTSTVDPHSAQGRRMITADARDADGQLLLTAPGQAAPKEAAQLMIMGKGQKEDIKGKGKALVDYEDDDEDAVEKEEPPESEQQVKVDTWHFTTRNAFMFGPAANAEMGAQTALPEGGEGTLGHEPKGIRYSATRMDADLQNTRLHRDRPSPTKSHIDAAIAGTPYPSSSITSTPKVGGYSFVDHLPTTNAAEIDSSNLEELMTWGTITGTPLRSSGSAARSALGEGGGPFKIPETTRRENIAHGLASKARRSLSDKVGRGGREGGIALGLRRSVLDSSSRRNKTPYDRSPFSPRGSARSEMLSPAARQLLSRTPKGASGVSIKGKATESLSEALFKDQGVRARQKAKDEARERERLHRQRMEKTRWSASPAPGLGGGIGRAEEDSEEDDEEEVANSLLKKPRLVD